MSTSSATEDQNQRDLGRFGYSSSSESDEPPRKTSNTNSSSSNQKKKKKKKPPPQQSINKIWRRFTAKQFSKALAVLPFDPVPLPSIPERPNELLAAGYERARDECSRKVKKIISECKRVNTRYRDPGFDLDWDLKWHKGHCLNYLGSNKFNLSSSRLSTNTSVPKAVKRVHEIFEKPTFMKNIGAGDVKQGSLGDCWLIASLSALANVEEGIKRICVEYDTRIGIYGFVFYRDGEWIYSIVDDKLYLTSPCWDSPSMQREILNQIDREDPDKVYRKTYQTGSKALFFAQCKDQHETWVALLEKAYAKAHGDYGSLAGGWIGEGLEDLSGGVTTELLASDILDLDAFWEDEICKVNKEFLFGCSTGLLDGGYGDRNGIREGHAYVIMDARTLKTGQRLVKLRNPWGKIRKGMWEGPWSDGSKEWNNDVLEELNHQFGNDSVFWITYEDMLEKYQHFDRTRLFQDPDWRCCQRWIGVEVPWKSQWNEKFHFKLTKESPLVLVLQQLDDRYYKGLHGQYSFRMHFRVHEQGRPESEDYIVRSHGNYLMDRSVSIEIPCMEPGNYSIFISVVAERNTHLTSIEDVVKRECKTRVENEKLAQVGYAYDLAHSKGVAHLEQVAKLRKKSDQKKASGSRMQERRKLWEKRHLNRDITKKQTKKNQEKRDRRREAAEARRKAKEEAEKAAAEAEEKEIEAAEEAKKKKEEAEAAEKKKQEEAEAAEKKKQEEAEAAEKKKKEEAEEAERKKQEEEKPKDAAVQTDDQQAGEDKSSQTEEAAQAKDEAATSESDTSDKPKDASTDDASKDTPADAETDAPKKDAAEAAKDEDKPAEKEKSEKETPDDEKPSEEKPVEKPVDEKSADETPADEKPADKTPAEEKPAEKPAPPPAKTKKQSPPPASYSSEGESSDSPVEDWELLYSSDDMSKKPRMSTTTTTSSTNNDNVESDGESGMPDPWNAICIVGFRVYSKDENLDLRVVLEGGDMAENGMGEKGAADIDNAQMNAGGEREKQKNKDVKDEVEIVDGEPVHKEKVVVPDDKQKDDEKKDDDKKGDEKKDDEAKDEKKEDEKKADEDKKGDEDKKDDEVKKDEAKKSDEKKDDKDADKSDEKKGEDDKKTDDEKKNDDEKASDENKEEEKGEDDGKDDCAKSDTSDSTDDSTPIPTPDTDSGDCTPQYTDEKSSSS
ncbi:cysteine proteinase [Hypoxylon rubiginosum]|uniref:Cysteine proteinase n=1 Tax=Hypoxylon rubiginosum TaxID=110542 RepID=A0ACB9YT35_9PEZI|nr:cysteine proteinase [Hypoxylon rubiginosum]